MDKETLLNRLDLLSSIGRVIEIPVELLYDESAWRTGHKKVEIFDGVEETRPPDEVFARLRELDERPHSYFGIRDGLVARVKAYSGSTITPYELSTLFEEGDDLTLGEFKPLGMENDFFTRLNGWYYGALGQRAFTWEGQVPIKLPNEPLTQQANARNLYDRIVRGDFGRDEEVVVQKWGSGGLLDPVVSFLDEVARLDEKNGTDVYGRIRYVISDISKKSVQESRTRATEDERTKKHLETGVLQFEVFDATKSTGSGIGNIESSYLYDSVSQPIIAKVNGKFYELHYRAYIDASRENEFQTNNYERINPHDFKRWLEEGDLEKLSQVRPRTFGNINWEVKLVEIDDIRQYANGRSLEEMTSGFDNVTLPTGETSLDSIKNAARSLRQNGYVQVFDLGISRERQPRKDTGKIHRYNGSVYAAVNFRVIAEALQKDGFEVNVEHLTDYLEGVLGERVLLTLCLSYCARDTETLDRFFPIEQMQKHKWIVETADRIKRQQGYSDIGRAEFYWALHDEGLTDWCRNTWFDRDRDKQDYVADFRESLRLAMYYRAFEGGPMWLFEQSPNETMVRRFETLGFKKGIVNHLFTHHREISDNLDYNHLSVQKGS